MEASSNVVIKVKYGDVLRRFNAPIVDGKCFLSMDGLREKIVSLFSFAPNADLRLTYVDEDGDIVALVDDDDLRDVVKQGLNPLRVTVKVNEDKNSSQNYSNSSSTPLVSPRAQHFPNLSAAVSQILRTVPEPLRDTLLKVTDELAAKASHSSPSISEIVDNLSKASSSLLGQQLSESGVTMNKQSSAPESCSATDNKSSEPLKADPISKFKKVKPAANMERKEVKIKTVTGQKEGPFFDYSAVAAALESQNADIAKPELVGVSNAIRRKEKAKKTVECFTGKSPVGKAAELPSQVDNKLTGNDICNSTEPKLESNSASDGSYSMNGNRGIDTSGLRDSFENVPPTWSGGLSFGSLQGTGLVYECPFSGTLENMSAAPLHCTSDADSFRRTNSQNDRGGNIFHRGVRCDGCGIHPIVGPRFKSKVKVDYDLCRVCFEKMGDDNEYIRMDRPAVYRHHLPHFRAREQGAMFPHVYRATKAKLGAVKLDSRFIQDVNIFDGTVMAPSTPFTKIWRMRNNGTVAWPPKTQLVWIGGDKLTHTHSVEVQIPASGLLMEHELDVAVDFISPELPGRYISYWRMASPSGARFGQRVWVLIQVDASNNETPQNSVRNLNLNLPPASSSFTAEIINVDPAPVVEPCPPMVRGSKERVESRLPNTENGPEIINVDPAPVVEARPIGAGNSKKVVESGLPNTENELKFPINDSLLVGNGAGSSPAAPSSSSSAQYPIVDLTDVVPTGPTAASPVLLPWPMRMPPPPPTFMLPPYGVPPSIIDPTSTALRFPAPSPPPPTETVATAPQLSAEVPEKDQIEDKLLKELEEMGFKQVDLNKEVLRMNEYDLEQSLDDLCGVAEWDPILEELKEMGFHDTEMNKMLLKKNNGSIKRVVMDLIAGEEV